MLIIALLSSKKLLYNKYLQFFRGKDSKALFRKLFEVDQLFEMVNLGESSKIEVGQWKSPQIKEKPNSKFRMEPYRLDLFTFILYLPDHFAKRGKDKINFHF